MFGKMMSIPDELMSSYYELVTDRTPQEIAAIKEKIASGTLHPMDAKMQLAREVISTFHGEEAAHKAADNFQRVFRDRQAPEEAKVEKLPRGPARKLTALLVDLNDLLQERSGTIDQAGRRRNDGVRIDIRAKTSTN
jgi:tyrosyl-tRNA synthetase